MRGQGGRCSRVGAIAACALTVALAASCQPGGTARRHARVDGGAVVVVASFNFAESELLAAIYGLAIKHAGIPMHLQLDLGPRELVQPALEEGLADVVPEYLGTALTSLEPNARVAMSNPAAVRGELARAFAQWHVQVLEPAAAQDQNGFAVTRGTADQFHLRTVSDLGPAAARMTIGGPAECPGRPYCLMGLHAVYGLRFAKFLPLDTEQQRVAALQSGVADVAVLFTTDGYLATGEFTLLSDNRRLQPAENVVPVVTTKAVARYGKRLVDALGAVSARLATKDLIFLNWRVTVAGKNVLAEARGWLERHGIVPRPD